MAHDSMLGIFWNCYACVRNQMPTEGRLLFSLRLTQLPFTDADGKEGFTAKVVGAWHPWTSGEYRW